MEQNQMKTLGVTNRRLSKYKVDDGCAIRWMNIRLMIVNLERSSFSASSRFEMIDTCQLVSQIRCVTSQCHMFSASTNSTRPNLFQLIYCLSWPIYSCDISPLVFIILQDTSGYMCWLETCHGSTCYLLLITFRRWQDAKKKKSIRNPQKLCHSKKYVDIVQDALLPRVREVEPGKHT